MSVCITYTSVNRCTCCNSVCLVVNYFMSLSSPVFQLRQHFTYSWDTTSYHSIIK